MRSWSLGTMKMILVMSSSHCTHTCNKQQAGRLRCVSRCQAGRSRSWRHPTLADLSARKTHRWVLSQGLNNLLSKVLLISPSGGWHLWLLLLRVCGVSCQQNKSVSSRTLCVIAARQLAG